MVWLWVLLAVVALGFLAYELWGTNTTLSNWLASTALSTQGILMLAVVIILAVVAVLAGLVYWYLQQPTNVVNQAAVSSAMDTAMGVN